MMFGRKRRTCLTDGVITLLPCFDGLPDAAMGFGMVHDFIILPAGERREAGRISLRLGESRVVYYFGHIGYHVEPPYRGRHFAARACLLLKPLIRACGKESVVITCDPDNLPSCKTCQGVGAVLERTVQVPEDIRRQWDISPVKHRYIWRMESQPVIELGEKDGK